MISGQIVPPRRRRLPGLATAAAVALVLAAMTSGCATDASSVTVTSSPATVSAVPVEPRSSGAPTDVPRGDAGAYQDPDLGGTESSAVGRVTPVRIRIGSIGVDSGLESLSRDAAGSIQPPADFSSAGWYSEGVVPGRIGPAVIAGHIDSAVGPAVFFRLSSLVAGDTISVSLSDGTEATFTVDGRVQVAKADFPTEQVYGPTPTPQLRLVTCGGVFDDSWGHYLDNIVVFAHLT